MPTQRSFNSTGTRSGLDIYSSSSRCLLAAEQSDRQEMGRTWKTAEQSEERLHTWTRRHRMSSGRSGFGGVKE